MIMKKIFEKIENKEEWIQKNNDGSFLVWKKSLNGLIVLLRDSAKVEFISAIGTITAFGIPESLLLLYLNENKVFLDKLQDFLTEQQKDVAHIVPEQFIEQIKDLALQYSTQTTLDTVNEYVTEKNWKLEIAPSPREDTRSELRRLYVTADLSTGLEDGWTCSNFSYKPNFFKKIGNEIMAIFTDSYNCIFHFPKTYFEVKFTKNSLKTLLTKYSDLNSMLKHCSQIAEKETVELQDLKESLTDVIKDYDCDGTFTCYLKKGKSYELNGYYYTPDTNEIKDFYNKDSICMILSNKEKEDLLKAVHDFDAHINYVHKNYICASYGNDTKLYYKQRKDSIYYNYVVEYVNGPNHITKRNYKSLTFVDEIDSIFNDEYFSKTSWHPIYISAKENNDRFMELMMKDRAGFILTNEEAKELEKLSKGEYLRRLGIEHNKLYVIDEKTIGHSSLLNNSGYILGHWPFCARMVRSGNPMINPHTKRGHDTSPRDCKEPVISFSEFLKLFEIPEENN